MTTSLIVKGARLSYLNAFKPRKNKDKNGNVTESYSVSMIIPKTHPQVEEIKAAIKSEVNAKWPDPKKRPNGLHNPLRDGDADRENDEAYAGCYFINANAQVDRAPKLIDAQLQPANPAYWVSGDYGNVKIDLYPFERQENKGIGVGLITIQFTKKGVPLGNRTDPDEGFTVEDVSEDPFA